MKKIILTITLAITMFAGMQVQAQDTKTITGTWKNGTAPLTFDEQTGVLEVGAGTIEGFQYKPFPQPLDEQGLVKRDLITKIVLTGDVKAQNNLYRTFAFMPNLEEIEGLTNLNTTDIEVFSGIFDGTPNLKTLDVSNFDTSNATNMYKMFKDTGVTYLDISNFDTRNVTQATAMFGQSKIYRLTLGEFTIFKDDGLLLYEPLKISQLYTGNWTLEGDESNPDVTYSNSDEFLSQYDGSRPGTYIWEVLQAEPDTTLPEIENPNPQNPDITLPEIENPNIQKPDIERPEIENPDTQKPDITLPEVEPEEPEVEPESPDDKTVNDEIRKLPNTGDIKYAMSGVVGLVTLGAVLRRKI